LNLCGENGMVAITRSQNRSSYIHDRILLQTSAFGLEEVPPILETVVAAIQVFLRVPDRKTWEAASPYLTLSRKDLLQNNKKIQVRRTGGNTWLDLVLSSVLETDYYTKGFADGSATNRKNLLQYLQKSYGEDVPSDLHQWKKWELLLLFEDENKKKETLNNDDDYHEERFLRCLTSPDPFF